MKKIFFLSLRFRMLTLVLLGVVPPMLVAIWFASFQAAQIIRQEAQENLALRATALADSVSRWDKMNINALVNLSRNPAFASMDAIQQTASLSATYSTYHPEVYGVSAVNAEGYTIASGRGKIEKEVVKRSVKDRVWFQGAVAGNTITRETLISRSYKAPAVVFSSPIWQVPTLKLGDQSPRVAALQEKLKAQNYYSSEINGIYDDTTASSIRNYQPTIAISSSRVKLIRLLNNYSV